MSPDSGIESRSKRSRSLPSRGLDLAAQAHEGRDLAPEQRVQAVLRPAVVDQTSPQPAPQRRAEMEGRQAVELDPDRAAGKRCQRCFALQSSGIAGDDEGFRVVGLHQH